MFPQTNRIAKHISNIYHVVPEFPWTNYPYDALFRNLNTKKWYALITEEEAIHLKYHPHDIQQLLNKPGYYPSYRMNEKYWISILLDDTLADEEMLKHIEISYSLSL
ncbi:MAG: MmcQ/YjbR family DNA-binding protein [Erysipelotrichaceae bacterium]|nr:MmcQ/YjbR family DNA-binding protein [Erysipelotrichaceae bacterium]